METGYSLGWIDLTIIVVYFVVVLAIGFWISARTKTGEDLFLAGRSLGWAAIGFSLFASNISSTTLIGLTGAAYSTGISVSNYEWMAAIVLVFFVIFVVPAYIRSRISTVPEFLERRFDRRSRVYFSGMTVIANIIVDTAGSLYAGAVVLQLFFPGLDLYTTCIVLAVIAGLYTAAGGLAAVVYTDVIQAIVLLVGSTAIAYLLFADVGFSWSHVVQETPPEMLSVIRPMDDPALPWLGTLIGVPVLGFYFWGTNQFIVQRVLGAKDLHHARWGSLLGGALKLPVLFIMVLPGTMARLVVPGLEDGDLVFPTLITEVLPVGMTGLVLAGLVAAIMSSIDSTLNSASTLVTLDFIQPRYPDMSPKQIARVGRIAIVAFMIFSALWAPQIAHFEGLFAYLQAVLSYIVPPVAALFIMGLFWKRGTGTAAFVTLLGGHGVSVLVFVGQLTGVLPDVHFTIVAGLLFFLSLGLFAAISLAGAPPAAEKLAVLGPAGVADAEAEARPVPWYADYRVLSGVLLVLTAAIVIAFW